MASCAMHPLRAFYNCQSDFLYCKWPAEQIVLNLTICTFGKGLRGAVPIQVFQFVPVMEEHFNDSSQTWTVTVLKSGTEGYFDLFVLVHDQ